MILQGKSVFVLEYDVYNQDIIIKIKYFLMDSRYLKDPGIHQMRFRVLRDI